MWGSPDARFSCSDLAFDRSTGTVSLGYRLSGGGHEFAFTETVRIPVTDALTTERRAVLPSVLALLHAVAGVSYYKAVAPPTIDLGSYRFTAAELAFIEGAYRQGMREFAYTNDLPAALTPRLEHVEPVAPAAPSAATDPDPGDTVALVPCGGGKDSIVTLEALVRSGCRAVSFAVNPKGWIRAVMAKSGTEVAVAERILDPLLLDLNSVGARNGHVPVTAINSLIAVAAALATGAGAVVMSNESSASIPNLVWQGVEVNHQWAKSLEAERLLAAALDGRGNPVRYFSLLRHLNEVQIAELFSHVSGYDDAVTSCNRAFTTSAAADARWCRDCPKCRFVFLVLAPFIPRARLTAIFGGDVLDDPSQVQGYRRLLGLGGARPFECVGDVDESLALLRRVGESPEWAETAVVRALRPEVTGAVPPWDDVLGRTASSMAPERWRRALDALA
jgi:hypothetical protein